MRSTFEKLCLVGVAALFLSATSAHAGLRVEFDEGAPKDRFRIKNTGSCPITNSSVLVDLSTSRGGLIFDVTVRGEGVEVFQPFEVESGGSSLAGQPIVRDGQTDIELDISSLGPQSEIVFTIDVDDTRGTRAITVSGAEIEGATVRYRRGQSTASAAFTARSTAVLSATNC